MKVFSFDLKTVRKKIDQIAVELVNSDPEIREIILFGSVARGDAVPGSDVDLLIILERSDLPFLERILKYTPVLSIGVDVFPYTRSEIDQMIGSGNHFVKRALSEGVTLFDKTGSGGRQTSEK